MLVYIQILRFVAAAAVAAFHAWGLAPEFVAVPEGTPSFGLQHGGHGVDLFFVISGFIIFYATRRAALTPAQFFRRRIERIVPLYYVVTFAVIALAFAFPSTLGTDGWFTPQHILKSLAFISFTDGEMPVVFLGWSLEYEMFFYLSVALLMALAQNPWRAIVVIFSSMVIVGRLPGVESALGNYSFLFDPLLLEFVLGVLVAGWFVDRRIGMPELVAAACALAALLIADPGNRVIVFGLPSAALVCAGAWISTLRTSPSFVETALARLGDASYAIYLVQVNTVWLCCKYIPQLVPGIAPLALVAATTVIVVLAGLLLNTVVERPLLRLSRSLAAPRVRDAQA